MIAQQVGADTIIAQTTPHGEGALALLRVSGPHAFEIVTKCARLSSRQPLVNQPSHTIHHGHVVDEEGTIIDHVLFFIMKAPRTFTGEHTVEISCHNNPHIIHAIITRIIQQGARQAKPGEFSQQAFLNNKIDLLQAEAINDLIHANTYYSLQKSLAQLGGNLSSYILKIEESLIQLLGLIEASFEFLDEEQRDIDFQQTVVDQVARLAQELTDIIKDFSLQQHLKEGVRITLIGSVNAGKSSLFNALIKKDRAIVSPIAGTTRDTIEAQVIKPATSWLLVDTAGIRHTHDIIEQEGIERSYQQADQADIVLLVIDTAADLTEHTKQLYCSLYEKYAQRSLMVGSKVDSAQKQTSAFIAMLSPTACFVSPQTGEGLISLERMIETKIKELFGQLNAPFLLNQRQYSIMLTLLQKIKLIAEALNTRPDYELLACTLKELILSCSQLSGKTVDEKVMDSVFSTFCVGK